MITRFYVDNYKCLQNFEYKPREFELVVGANGSGKSTVFEALDKVRQFIAGEDAMDLFSVECRTRWSNRAKQVFEIDFREDKVWFQYHLEVNLESVRRVEKEMIFRDGNLLFETVWVPSNSGEFTELDKMDNDFNTHFGEVRKTQWPDNRPGHTLTDANGSMLSLLQWKFLDVLQGTHFFKLNAPLMTSQVKRAIARPSSDLSDFASYYIYVLQQQQGKMFEMMPYLKEVIPDFDSFAVDENFEEARRDLFVVCRSKAKGKSRPIRYRFDELSDGQRALIALYTLLFCTLDANTTLVIDEPENYVALRELQPWLMLLQERLEEHGGQVILISHHPEFINALAPQATVFERNNSGPVRIKEFDSELAKTLAPSEILARGWQS